jgi:hypothetical protein
MTRAYEPERDSRARDIVQIWALVLTHQSWLDMASYGQ